MPGDDDDLTLALHLADLADAISLPRFGAADLQVTAKPDLTPVSDADLAVETAIRERLAVDRPGDLVVGEVSAPALARRWWAAAGAGAFTAFAGGPPRRCRVSGVRSPADASLSYSEPAEWRAAGRERQFQGLLDACWRTRAYGDFYSYMLVAEGAVDVAAEPELSLWDVAALMPIVTEAGGRFTGIDGQPSGGTTVSALATNGLLHADVVTLLNE